MYELMNFCDAFKCLPYPPHPKVWARCSNLVQNPGFEFDLQGWVANNVIAFNDFPFEGTHVARMGSGVASLAQDVPVSSLNGKPLFIGFEAFPGADVSAPAPLTVEVLWLDRNRNTISVGLRKILDSAIATGVRTTFFDVTDQPPAGTAFARILFSKEAGTPPTDVIDLDQVILTPVKSINLVQNPGFELGLTGWGVVNFTHDFNAVFEGVGAVLATLNGILVQDIPITGLPQGSPFLFGFSASVEESDVAALTARVEWLDESDGIIGQGLEIIIPRETLFAQDLYLSYLDITDPAPAGTAKARILFTASDLLPDSRLRIDQVILARVELPNFVLNSSFESGLNNWTSVNATSVQSDRAYEGFNFARLSGNGGYLFQDIPVTDAEGHCYLFNFGYRPSVEDPGLLKAEVHWLDSNGMEIGLGLSLIIPSSALPNKWVAYTGVTEPAPAGTAMARVQFSAGARPDSFIDIDKVVFGR